MSDGLPTNDIWGLLEDKTGKIWLSSISNEFGYMQNDKFHYARLPKITNTLYPQQINKWNNGLIFISPDSAYTRRYAIWMNDGDSIRKYTLPKYFNADNRKIDLSNPVYYMFIYIDGDKNISFFYEKYMFKATLDHDSVKLDYITTIKWNIGSWELLESDLATKDILIHKELILTTKIETINLHSGICTIYDLKKWGLNQPILRMEVGKQGDSGMLLAYTDDYLIKFQIDTALTYLTKIPIQNLSGINKTANLKINTIVNDSFWKNCIGTSNSGVYFNYKINNHFIKEQKINLHNYRYVGGKTDHENFWWNATNSSLIKITGDLTPSYLTCSSVNDINNIAQYNDDTFMIMGKDHFDGVLWLKNEKNQIFKNFHKHINNNIYSIIKTEKNSFYFVAQTGFHFTTLVKDSFVDMRINGDRFKGLQFDKMRNEYWAFNDDKILIHSDGGDQIFKNKDLMRFGVKKIDQILIDTLGGNIFIKGDDKINLYNQSSGSAEAIFPNVNVKKSKMIIYKDLLIVSGRFGVSFTKITGGGRLSKPLLYPNIKDINYKYVYDVQASYNKLLLNTDKGAFWVDIPPDETITNATNSYTTSYKCIANYKDSLYEIKQNDSILFDQKNMRILLDVINPSGNGRVRYQFKINTVDSTWRELNSNELTLPQWLNPGKYYVVTVKAYDEVWISDDINVVVYIKPYWWQLLYQSKLFWSGVFILFMALLALTIYLTRIIVNRNNAKKNLRQSLELKSVYSQINPHFIFNTLGTLMYFIRKKETEEAYRHVSKFSKLLRAYIKSARNKYITIESEIENLNNYIQLQQSRFEDRFDYSITVDNDINTDTVKIPSLLLQPIVENAIDHGLFHRETTGFLKIEFKKIPLTNEIECIIDDNGIGRKKSKIISANSIVKSESYGEQLITDLVTIFNKYEKINISIKYIDKEEPETGTTVIINIKYPKDAK